MGLCFFSELRKNPALVKIILSASGLRFWSLNLASVGLRFFSRPGDKHSLSTITEYGVCSAFIEPYTLLRNRWFDPSYTGSDSYFPTEGIPRKQHFGANSVGGDFAHFLAEDQQTQLTHDQHLSWC